jgi:hypothetical protein
LHIPKLIFGPQKSAIFDIWEVPSLAKSNAYRNAGNARFKDLPLPMARNKFAPGSGAGIFYVNALASCYANPDAFKRLERRAS